MSSIPSSDGQENITKNFYGDFAPTPTHATENVYDEVLKCLTSEKMIVVDDYSYPALMETKSSLNEATAHLMIADSLETDYDMAISHIRSGYSIILSEIYAICMKFSGVLPISVTQEISGNNDQATTSVEYTGLPNPEEPTSVIAKFLADLRRTTTSFM